MDKIKRTDAAPESISMRGLPTDKATVLDYINSDNFANQPEGVAALAELIRRTEFDKTHANQSELLASIDSLTAKLRNVAEGLIVSSDERAEAARVNATKEVDAYKSKADALKAEIDRIKGVEAERAALQKDFDEVKKSLESERAAVAQHAARIAELEAEREAVKEREARAEADRAARAEAEKAQLEAEKARVEAEREAETSAAALMAAKSEIEKMQELHAQEIKAAQAEIDRTQRELTKQEGRAEALETQIAGLRDELSAALRAGDKAATMAEARQEQVAQLTSQLELMMGKHSTDEQ